MSSELAMKAKFLSNVDELARMGQVVLYTKLVARLVI
jgi:hypothetical protein